MHSAVAKKCHLFGGTCWREGSERGSAEGMDFLRMLWLSTLLAMAPHCVSPTTSYVGFYPTGRAWEHVGTRRLQTDGSRPAAAAACCPLRPRPVPSRLSSCSRLWYAATHDERSVAAGAARFAGEGQQDTGDQDGVQGFYGKAEQLLKAAGGQLDSLAFGRNWKRAYPGDDLEKYKGAGAATIAQMLAQSPRFRVADRPGGGPGKLFILDPKPARPEPAASSIPLAPPPSFSSPAVEQRQSKRGYSFSVIKKDPTRGGAGSGTVRATSNPPAGSSRTSPEAQGSSQPYEERNAPGNSRGQRPEGNSSGRRGKASELIDIWSQAASLSDADDAGVGFLSPRPPPLRVASVRLWMCDRIFMCRETRTHGDGDDASQRGSGGRTEVLKAHQ